MDIVYAWDEHKMTLVMEQHNVTFGEVVDVFDDPRRLDELDPQGSADRLMIVGQTLHGRLLQVIFTVGDEFTDRGASILRIITAFDAGSLWREVYEGAD